MYKTKNYCRGLLQLLVYSRADLSRPSHTTWQIVIGTALFDFCKIIFKISFSTCM